MVHGPHWEIVHNGGTIPAMATLHRFTSVLTRFLRIIRSSLNIDPISTSSFAHRHVSNALLLNIDPILTSSFAHRHVSNALLLNQDNPLNLDLNAFTIQSDFAITWL
ncbi:unnamed protein product [Vicia faba]|nr:unnamed protein product [Vicia faba]